MNANQALEKLINDRPKTDRDLVLDCKENIKLAISKEIGISEIFDVLHENGFKGNREKFTKILQDLGLHKINNRKNFCASIFNSCGNSDRKFNGLWLKEYCKIASNNKAGDIFEGQIHALHRFYGVAWIEDIEEIMRHFGISQEQMIAGYRALPAFMRTRGLCEGETQDWLSEYSLPPDKWSQEQFA